MPNVISGSARPTLLHAVYLLPKAYLCGLVAAITPHVLFLIAHGGSVAQHLKLYWSDVILAGVWSIIGFLASPYALYRVFAFLPEQAGLSSAARCFQSGAIYTHALEQELSIINSLFAGAIYFMLVGAVVVRDLRRGRSRTSATTSWRLLAAATVIAICAIYAKDELVRVIGWRNYICA